MKHKLTSILDISQKLRISVDQTKSIVSILDLKPRKEFKNNTFRNHCFNEDDFEAVRSFLNANKETFNLKIYVPEVLFELDLKNREIIVHSKINNNDLL